MLNGPTQFPNHQLHNTSSAYRPETLCLSISDNERGLPLRRVPGISNLSSFKCKSGVKACYEIGQVFPTESSARLIHFTADRSQHCVIYDMLITKGFKGGARFTPWSEHLDLILVSLLDHRASTNAFYQTLLLTRPHPTFHFSGSSWGLPLFC